MNIITETLLKQGWTQVGGEDIPVYFKYESNCHVPKLPFHIIFCGDKEGYYIKEAKTIEKIKEKRNLDIDKHVIQLTNCAFEHTYTSAKILNKVITTLIGDYYFWNRNKIKQNKYEEIAKFLIQNKI